MEIHLKPSIWDTSSEEYKNRDKKLQDWQDVAAASNGNWDTLSKTQKDEFCKYLNI